MNTAIDAGIDAVIEFGGGIGKGDGPDGKRPNLETIVKKSLKSREHQAQYLPAINAATIRATAEQLLGRLDHRNRHAAPARAREPRATAHQISHGSNTQWVL